MHYWRKKLKKSRAQSLGLESPNLVDAIPRYEVWKAARTMEQRFMEQLQQQQQIQRTLEEKLQSMQQHNMKLPTQALTGQRVSTKGSCSSVDHTDYTSQYELLVDEDPPRVVSIGR